VHLPWSKRRQLLESRDLNGRSWFTPDWFDDGEALFQVVVDQGLEGIVAKRRSSTYRPGERGWVKVKHRDYWRFGQELELARRRRATSLR
jgi:bifunctional non-homologous end joining protein LigD